MAPTDQEGAVLVVKEVIKEVIHHQQQQQQQQQHQLQQQQAGGSSSSAAVVLIDDTVGGGGGGSWHDHARGGAATHSGHVSGSPSQHDQRQPPPTAPTGANGNTATNSRNYNFLIGGQFFGSPLLSSPLTSSTH